MMRWLAHAVLCATAACSNRNRSNTEILQPPSVDAALLGFAAEASIRTTLATTEGPIHCELDPSRAPQAVALFVGLATGRASWIDPRTGAVTRRPLYRDLAFHRAIPHVLVQSGCPIGDSTGHPGYRIAVEPAADDARRLARPGAFFLARYTPAPGRPDPHPPPKGLVLGSQFVIALTDMSHLAGQVSVLGLCRDLDTVDRIADQRASGSESPRLIRVSLDGETASEP